MTTDSPLNETWAANYAQAIQYGPAEIKKLKKLARHNQAFHGHRFAAAFR